ncbi:hypothetical protein QGP82_25505 [Leptothoe sp. LEGE 181152]|nr:hypothetical protein [Leptothoe sp. LEGE 181152]
MTEPVENHLENLDLHLEHDNGLYDDLPGQEEAKQEVSNYKIIINGSSEGALDDCFYITVDPNYTLSLSMGQRSLYEILLSFQESAVYTITTIGKLAEAMGLKDPLAASKRLENLQTLKAIDGYKA